jgi:hypothetical protein
MKTILTLCLLLLTSPVFAACELLTVSWTPPTENTDGSPLTNLDGFNLFYTDRTGEDFVIRIDDPSQTEHELNCVQYGAASFHMTATAGDAESDSSEVIQKTVAYTGARLQWQRKKNLGRNWRW